MPLGAALAVVFIVVGTVLVTRHHGSPVNAGSVPTSQRPTLPTLPPVATLAPVTRLTDAPTIAVSQPLGVSPAAAGPAAPTAPTPVGSNVLPIHVVQLRIPAKQVDAPVVDIGVGANGLLIPSDPKVVGRWDGGANPGEPYGTVVLAGHVDNTTERGALFYLSTLPVGATVVALGADGRGVTYRVTGLREVSKLDLSDLNVFSQSTEARLVLITCGGSFDSNTHSYADNVVVFAVPTSTG